MSDAVRLWQETTNRLAREASVRVTATYLRYAEGALALQEAIGIQATLIAAAQRRAVTVNDMLLAAELVARLEAEYAATGMQWMETVDDQIARLSKAVTTVLGDDVAYLDAMKGAKTREQLLQMQARSIRARLERLTRGEVCDASQWARQTAMMIWHEEGAIAGWYRRVSPKGCSWCRILAGPGDPAQYVHPVQHRMASHKGCTCSQGFVTEVEPWQKWVGPAEQMKSFSG